MNIHDFGLGIGFLGMTTTKKKESNSWKAFCASKGT